MNNTAPNAASQTFGKFVRTSTDGNSSHEMIVNQDYSSTINNANTMMMPANNNSALNENSMSFSAQQHSEIVHGGASQSLASPIRMPPPPLQ